MTDAYHQQVVQQLEQARAELAALHTGEEEYTDERITPTPGQFIWRWNHGTPEQRLTWATHLLAALDTAHTCTTISFHSSRIAELTGYWHHDRQRADRAEARMAVLERNLRAAEDELAVHRQRAAARPVETRHLVEIHRDGIRVHGDDELTGAGPEALTALLGPCTVPPPVPLMHRVRIGPCILTGLHAEHRDANGTQWAPIRPGCPDPIECEHEAALGLAENRIAMVRAVIDGAGAPYDGERLLIHEIRQALDAAP